MLSFIGIITLKCYNNGPVTLVWNILDLIMGE